MPVNRFGPIRIVIWCCISVALVSCSSLFDVGNPPSKKQSGVESAVPEFDGTLDVYYNGNIVGKATIKSEYIDYGPGDSDLRDTITEEIEYRGSKFRFIFLVETELVQIKVLKFRKNGTINTGDSYGIVLDPETVKHLYYEDDGTTIRSERSIVDRTIRANTRELFQDVMNYLHANYDMKNYGQIRPKRRRILSLGYDLLNHDRI